jgi:hypothetical protein
VLGTKPRALCMLGKWCASEPHPQPPLLTNTEVDSNLLLLSSQWRPSCTYHFTCGWNTGWQFGNWPVKEHILLQLLKEDKVAQCQVYSSLHNEKLWTGPHPTIPPLLSSFLPEPKSLFDVRNNETPAPLVLSCPYITYWVTHKNI